MHRAILCASFGPASKQVEARISADKLARQQERSALHQDMADGLELDAKRRRITEGKAQGKGGRASKSERQSTLG